MNSCTKCKWHEKGAYHLWCFNPDLCQVDPVNGDTLGERCSEVRAVFLDCPLFSIRKPRPKPKPEPVRAIALSQNLPTRWASIIGFQARRTVGGLWGLLVRAESWLAKRLTRGMG